MLVMKQNLEVEKNGGQKLKKVFAINFIFFKKTRVLITVYTRV
jgi:hypothetical protein